MLRGRSFVRPVLPQLGIIFSGFLLLYYAAEAGEQPNTSRNSALPVVLHAQMRKHGFMLDDVGTPSSSQRNCPFYYQIRQ